MSETGMVTPLHPGQATVIYGHEKETGKEIWLVSATFDGAEIIVADCPSEQEAIAAAAAWRDGR